MRQFGEQVEGWSYAERPGAYAIIRDRPGSLLLVVETPFGIYLPGGGLEPEETIEACLRREVLEETGYDIAVGEEIARAAQYRISRRKNAAFNKLCQFFLAQIVTDPIQPSEPDHTTHWISAQEAQSRLREEASCWAVAQAFGG